MSYISVNLEIKIHKKYIVPWNYMLDKSCLIHVHKIINQTLLLLILFNKNSTVYKQY